MQDRYRRLSYETKRRGDSRGKLPILPGLSVKKTGLHLQSGLYAGKCYIFSGASKPRMSMQVSKIRLARPMREM